MNGPGPVAQCRRSPPCAPRAFHTAGRCASTSSKHVLTGFSVPAQHRLGDDDLNYNLCGTPGAFRELSLTGAAVHRHAQRQYRSRLPPWLVKISLPRRAKRFRAPTPGSPAPAGTVHGPRLGARREDEGSS